MHDADFLHTAFKGQQDAVDLVMALVRVSQCWDDLVDRDKPVGAGAINAAFYDALVGIPSNPFYRKHMDILLPVGAVACMNYEIANSFEHAGGTQRLEIAHVLRYSVADVATAVLLIIGGPDWVREYGPGLRERGQKDNLANCLTPQRCRPHSAVTWQRPTGCGHRAAA